ncbi:hypothetical protein N752_04405 [Desulforamulus aquiferis]|nr:SpoIID/LytB domain-containing protein [Desulforamulus aquiferis]RYD06410.1 hypothetical protein N752_04405 [Desulforamulus aquiferis]
MQHRSGSRLVTFVLMVLLLFSISSTAFANTGDYRVRIGLVTNGESLGFRANANFQLVNLSTGTVISEVKSGEQWQIQKSNDSLSIIKNGTQIGIFDSAVAVRQFTGKPVTIYSAESAAIASGSELFAVTDNGTVTNIGSNLNNLNIISSQGMSQISSGSSETGLLTLEGPSGSKRYRGELEFKIDGNGKMLAINVVPVEEYLYGVVPSEMPSSFGHEALKAQALAARTYALRLHWPSQIKIISWLPPMPVRYMVGLMPSLP